MLSKMDNMRFINMEQFNKIIQYLFTFDSSERRENSNRANIHR